MELKSLINQYLRLKGGYPLQSNDSVIKLTINDDTIIAFEESLDHGNFYLFSIIDSITPERELEVLKEALTSNLFHKETGEGSIGFDKDTKALVLFEKISLEHMDEYKLQERITKFLAYLSYLKAKYGELTLLHKGNL